MGTPNKITRQVLLSIANYLFDGFSNDDIAFFHDLNVKTVDRIRHGLECPEVRKATLARKAIYIAKIRDGKSKGWARIAWFLERRYPKEFARPEIQLTLGAQHVTNNTLVVSAEQADDLIKRSTRLNKEIDSLIATQRPLPERLTESNDSITSDNVDHVK